MNEYLEKYLTYLKLKNYSEATIRSHCFYLKKLLVFLEDRNLLEITPEKLKEYQKYRYYFKNRYGRQDCATVLNRNIVIIKSFFRFLKKEGVIYYDPSESLEYAKVPKTLPKNSLTNDEMKRLLKEPDTTTAVGYRNRTILEVFYSTGIRRQELANLRLEDIDYEKGFLRINKGKGGKDRIVPVGKIACKFLETFIIGVRPFYPNAHIEKTLFLNKLGKGLKRCGLDLMVKKYAKQSGIKKEITMHTFRRSCATEMIKNRANIMHVKDILGHNSMQSIQSYCNLTIIDLKEAHKKYHPRERDKE